MVTKRSEGTRWEGDTGRWRSPALLLPPPPGLLSLPPLSRRHREGHQKGAGVLKGSFPTLHTNRFTGRYSKKSSHLKHSAETKPPNPTPQPPIVTLSASYLEVFGFLILEIALTMLLWRLSFLSSGGRQRERRGDSRKCEGRKGRIWHCLCVCFLKHTEV